MKKYDETLVLARKGLKIEEPTRFEFEVKKLEKKVGKTAE